MNPHPVARNIHKDGPGPREKAIQESPQTCDEPGPCARNLHSYPLVHTIPVHQSKAVDAVDVGTAAGRAPGAARRAASCGTVAVQAATQHAPPPSRWARRVSVRVPSYPWFPLVCYRSDTATAFYSPVTKPRHDVVLVQRELDKRLTQTNNSWQRKSRIVARRGSCGKLPRCSSAPSAGWIL